ncbi:MAG: DNA repair protein RadA [Planctomycetes bacterium]|nr:DNA repair protein RadA [Planctomycetota bacterium]MCQ3949934.1 DNA repair protein RadA [Planctomycetota bacterium]GIK53155.1 MAG: DNA repair protein RadA [Planctomycetota bacterium]HRJ78140.1 DNA repair protein RadA [Planctomycetota bacterium]
MAKNKSKLVFACRECGHNSPKWLGKCPACGAWNSFAEEIDAQAIRPSRRAALNEPGKPARLSEISASARQRLATGLNELDRVLGGGLVAGSAILFAGAPGIGKSTLTLQAANRVAQVAGPVLYVTGEESAEQIKLRAARLKCDAAELFVVAETNLDAIRNHLQALKPRLAVIDSVQTLYDQELPSAPGSVAQVRECAAGIIMQAKSSGTPVFLVGHVTKDGNIAGPRTLEHMVDTVLNFEGEKYQSYRLLRASKNRFGSTGELGVFEMRGDGLAEVENASRIFLDEYDHSRSGCAVLPACEGTRVLLVEVQALAAPSPMENPRRRVTGLDANRAHMLLAVMERRAGFKLSRLEVYLNIVGGVTVEEPAGDLAACFAVASSATEVRLPPATVFVGEVGLSGEVRAVNNLQQRIDEAARLGFKQAVGPRLRGLHLRVPADFRVLEIGDLREGLEKFYLAGR